MQNILTEFDLEYGSKRVKLKKPVEQHVGFRTQKKVSNNDITRKLSQTLKSRRIEGHVGL